MKMKRSTELFVLDKEGKVASITGKDIDIKADSVCVHGDGEKALLFVEKIRKTFVENEIEICHL